MAGRPEHVGILALEVYFPATRVLQVNRTARSDLTAAQGQLMQAGALLARLHSCDISMNFARAWIKLPSCFQSNWRIVAGQEAGRILGHSTICA